MKQVVALLVVGALMAGPAFAAENPNIAIYLDADPPSFTHRVDPAPSATFDAYVCLAAFGAGGGSRGTGFLIVRDWTGFKLGQTALMNGLDFGDAEADGWTIAAGTDCIYPDVNGVVVVGSIQYLYQSGTGSLTLSPHPGTGRRTLDCDFQEDDMYCIHAHLGVGADPPDGEAGCETPVSAASWGGIKALYR